MKIVGVKFLSGGKVYYFNPENKVYRIGDLVLVKTVLGVEAGKIVLGKEIDPKIFKKQLMPVLRAATEDDIEKFNYYREKKEETLEFCRKNVKRHSLPMHLLDVHFSLDDEKVTIIFASETRVDFRELVKDLIRVFRKQVILRQVGPRDAARISGGFGRCGRRLCCNTFLDNLESVTMDMARDQGLDSKGSSKISGICGKLMCCLMYEADQYSELKKNLPVVGTKVKLTNGSVGKVSDQNVLKQTLLVELEDGGLKIETPLKDIAKLIK